MRLNLADRCQRSEPHRLSLVEVAWNSSHQTGRRTSNAESKRIRKSRAPRQPSHETCHQSVSRAYVALNLNVLNRRNGPGRRTVRCHGSRSP